MRTRRGSYPSLCLCGAEHCFCGWKPVPEEGVGGECHPGQHQLLIGQGAMGQWMRPRGCCPGPTCSETVDALRTGDKDSRVPMEVAPPTGSFPRADWAHLQADVTPRGPGWQGGVRDGRSRPGRQGRGLEMSPSATGAGGWAAFSSLAAPLSSWRELLIAAPWVHRRDRSIAHKGPGFLNLSSFFLVRRCVWGIHRLRQVPFPY